VTTRAVSGGAFAGGRALRWTATGT
jgi:hypothetical protein